MSTIVRMKDCEQFPCPLKTPDSFVEESWKVSRGKEVVLLRTISVSQVDPRIRCGSDTYWEVARVGAVQDALDISGNDPRRMCLCRHVLEIGD